MGCSGNRYGGAFYWLLGAVIMSFTTKICFSSGALTGYGFVFGIRQEFQAECYSTVANTEDLGPLDAPDNIAAGAMRNGNEFGIQQNVLRP